MYSVPLPFPYFALQVDYSSKTAVLGGRTLKEGDWLSLNGSTGEVLEGKQPVKPPEMSGEWGGGQTGRQGGRGWRQQQAGSGLEAALWRLPVWLPADVARSTSAVRSHPRCSHLRPVCR